MIDLEGLFTLEPAGKSRVEVLTLPLTRTDAPRGLKDMLANVFWTLSDLQRLHYAEDVANE